MDTDTFDVSDDVLEARHAAARALLAALYDAANNLAGLANTGFVWSPDRTDADKKIFAGALRANEAAMRQAIAQAEAAGIASPDEAEG